MLSTRRAAEDVIDLTSDPEDDVVTHILAQDSSNGSGGSSSSSGSSDSTDKAVAAAAAAAADMAFHRHQAAVIVNGPSSTGFELPLSKFLPKVDWKKIHPIRTASDLARSDYVLSNNGSNKSSSSHSHSKTHTQQQQLQRAGGSLEYGEKAGVKGNINSKFHVREKSGAVVEYPQPVPSLIVMNFLRKHFPNKRSFMEAFAASSSNSSSNSSRGVGMAAAAAAMLPLSKSNSRNAGGSSSSSASSHLLRAALSNSSANSFDSAMHDILMFQGIPLSTHSSSHLQTLDGAINRSSSSSNAMFFLSDDIPNAQSTAASTLMVDKQQQPTITVSAGNMGGKSQQSKQSSGQVGGRMYARDYPSQSLSSDPLNLSELSSMSVHQQQQQLMMMQGMQATGLRYAPPFSSTVGNIQPYMQHTNSQPTTNAPSLLQSSSDSYQQASSHQYAVSMQPTAAAAASSSQGSSQSLNQLQYVLTTTSGAAVTSADGGAPSRETIQREAIHLERSVQFFFQSDRSSDNPFKPSVNDLAVRFLMPYQLFNDSLKRCDFAFIH